MFFLFAYQGMIMGEERNEQAWIEVKGKGRTHLKPFAGSSAVILNPTGW